jgi:hypothetical protein
MDKKRLLEIIFCPEQKSEPHPKRQFMDYLKHNLPLGGCVAKMGNRKKSHAEPCAELDSVLFQHLNETNKLRDPEPTHETSSGHGSG